MTADLVQKHLLHLLALSRNRTITDLTKYAHICGVLMTRNTHQHTHDRTIVRYEGNSWNGRCASPQFDEQKIHNVCAFILHGLNMWKTLMNKTSDTSTTVSAIDSNRGLPEIGVLLVRN
jgi:hypothetical protein